MIRTKRATQKPTIDLTGPQGNAHFLLGMAKRYAEQLELDWKTIEAEMTASDYENLIKSFDKHFGEFVILER